jgi:hypothetical protein
MQMDTFWLRQLPVLMVQSHINVASQLWVFRVKSSQLHEKMPLRALAWVPKGCLRSPDERSSLLFFSTCTFTCSLRQ